MMTQTTASAPPAPGIGFRRSVMSNEPSILAEIYQDQVNIAIWQRDFSETLKRAVKYIVDQTPDLQISLSLSSKDVYTPVNQALGESRNSELLSQDITGLIDMFCCLFDLQRIGLKLAVLDHVRCPKFHADQVPCRLLTTYQGEATEWLPHHIVDRTKLGPGSRGKPDEESGLYQSTDQVKQLKAGEVALLKGELWVGNESAGLVHRSPQLHSGQKRLLLTIDFME
ncbi:MAG: DUF1826 domain-containing protein [Gammaproteobacteria bacterium]|nr:DUF1826 domain-containing protein [Gammaproteobacteria bacterium]